MQGIESGAKAESLYRNFIFKAQRLCWPTYDIYICVAYTKCIATLWYHLIYLFVCPRESNACHVV